MPSWFVPAVATAAMVVLVIVAFHAGRVQGKAVKPDAPPPAKGPHPAAKDAAKSAPSPGETPPAPDSSPDAVHAVTVTTNPSKAKNAPRASADASSLPKIEDDEDDDVDPTRVGMNAGSPKKAVTPPTKKIVYDEDAEADDPTKPGALILLAATAQTDKGLRRKRNEDNLLVLAEEGVYVVADGMGGYTGGEIASEIAVKTIERVFRDREFPADPHENIPRRASDLARAIQTANEAILERAAQDKRLEGMGTTICAARFSPTKQRLYVAHVGDSRMYRLRAGKLRQMTSDHTMKDLGMTGPGSDHLSRAVGVWPTVPIDILLAKPMPGDVYLLCSDGLTKMVTDDAISSILAVDDDLSKTADALVRAANERGGKDNITAVLIKVFDPSNAANH